MDIFGFSTQGVNYDKFRPRYPVSFIQECLSTIKNKNKYLDVATGTGQLLFALSPSFQSSIGIDISQNMITAATKASETFRLEHPLINHRLEVKDLMDLPILDKYDLITVGQALHFFPGEQSLIKMRSILSQKGCFTTFGYIVKQILSKNQKQNDYYCQFYHKIKPLFTFDRDDLHTFLRDPAKYPFDKVFKRVERQIEEVSLPLSKVGYLSYLRTMSGYNLYLKQFKDDPLIELEAVCADQVECVLFYFRISCYND